jgi:transposase InsO family protein
MLVVSYTIVFYDDYTSMGWVLAIHTKDRALSATKEFLTYVSNQYNTQVKGWMSDAGGEFKSTAYKQLMCDHGIHIYESAPHTPQ